MFARGSVIVSTVLLAGVSLAAGARAEAPSGGAFDGFYGGLFVGGRSAEPRTLTTVNNTLVSTPIVGSPSQETRPDALLPRNGRLDEEQIVGGLRAGYGRTFGGLYLGGEVEAQFGRSLFEFNVGPPFGGVPPDFQRVELKESLSPALRLGYVVGDRGLIFARLGWTFTRAETAFSNFADTFGTDVVGGSRRDWVDGPRVGLGAEVAVGGGLSLRADVARTFYREDSFGSVRSTAPLGSTGQLELSSLDETTVALGLTYRFGARERDADLPPLAAWFSGGTAAGPFDGLYGGLFVADRSAAVRTRATIANPSPSLPTSIIGSSRAQSREFGDNGEIDADRAVGGVRLGYGKALDRLYLGAELEVELGRSTFEFNRGGTDPANPDFERVELRESLTPALRLGYVVNDSLLLFGRLGWTFRRVEAAFSNFTFAATDTALADDASEWINGPRLGIGADIRLADGLVLRADAARTYYRRDSFPRPFASDPGGTTGALDILGIEETTFSVGLGYQLGARSRSAADERSPTIFDGFYVALDAGNRGANAKTRTRVGSSSLAAPIEFTGQPHRRGALSAPNGQIEEDKLIGALAVGYGQTHGRFYLGGELGIGIGDSNFEFNIAPQGGANGTDFSRVELKETITPTVRLGYVLGDGVLVYGRTGWRFVRTTAAFRNFAFTAGTDVVEGSDTTWSHGPLVGGGVEIAIDNNWRLRFEGAASWITSNLPEISTRAPLGSTGDFSATKASETLFTAGLAYRF